MRDRDRSIDLCASISAGERAIDLDPERILPHNSIDSFFLFMEQRNAQCHGANISMVDGSIDLLCWVYGKT